MPDKAVAFLRLRSLPLANQVVFQRLQTAFPDHRFDLFDLSLLVRQNRILQGRNLFSLLRHYGGDVLIGRKKRHRAFWRTPFIFNQVKALLAERISPNRYSFTFQMQSMFDGSVPGIPHFVYTDHTHLANYEYPGVDRNKLYPALWTDNERRIYQNATRVFVRSDNIRRSVIEDYGVSAAAVSCVYAGANADIAADSVPSAPAATRNVLFIGFDWERKGGPELVEAMRLVQQRIPEASLTIVGCRPEIELNNCTIYGPLGPDELEPLFRKAQLFCMPSRLEPFGIVYVEAMTRGLPIVATNMGAVTDMVTPEENGLLVDVGNVAGLAGALTRLLADPELCARFGQASWRRTRQRYNWDTVISRMADEIRQTVDVKWSQT